MEGQQVRPGGSRGLARRGPPLHSLSIPHPPLPRTHPAGGLEFYFVWCAACTTVEVDVLTGEVELLTSDIVYDVGTSLNPLVDVGQVLLRPLLAPARWPPGLPCVVRRGLYFASCSPCAFGQGLWPFVFLSWLRHLRAAGPS